MTKKLSDDQIVANVIKGNLDDFSLIVERYEQPLLRYARGIVFSSPAASDVVQESFIKSYVNLRSYRPGKKFSSWIYRITHNEAINYLRKNRRELTTAKEDWFDHIVDDKESITEMLDKQYDQKKLQLALTVLKTKYREPLLLHYMQGRSYQEISEIMHLPSPTVGTRIKRAKSQLRQALKELS